jgi:hypothetical protein
MTILVACMLSTGLAWGATNAEKRTPSQAQQIQRGKMKPCNVEASKQGLKGDERKKFMSTCLKAKPVETLAKPAEAPEVKPAEKSEVKPAEAPVAKSAETPEANSQQEK